jgi:23S rRNA (adenine2030-N6)-methyltransferase
VNYRHAYHAGGSADLFKHVVLVTLLDLLTAKDKPLAYLDSHAGIGRYDLTSEAAAKTGEALAGIVTLRASLAEAPTKNAALARFAALVQAAQPSPDEFLIYPGSPGFAAACLRETDQMILVEAHPDDAQVLGRQFRRDRRVHVHHRDGWEAITGLLPPAEKRGLLLIDPPFEKADEFTRLSRAAVKARARFPGGCVALWHPIKADEGPVRQYYSDMVESGLREILKIEFRAPLGALKGSGMILVNPPWRADVTLKPMLEELAARLGSPGAASQRWLVAE